MSSGESESPIVVYTAIFDDYDILIDPLVVESGVDYICFSDNPELTSDVWETRVISPMADPVLSNRRIKILAHEYLEKYDTSLYIDGNIQIQNEIRPLVEGCLSTSDISFYAHPRRRSLFEEAETCIDQDKAEEVPVRAQMARYRETGFPDDLGLSANRILFRRHQEREIQDLMLAWWQEVSEYVNRDQLSLMYVLWEHDAEYNLIPYSVQDAPQFQVHPHRPDGYLGLLWPYWMSIRADPNPTIWKQTVLSAGKALSVLKNEGIVSLASKAVPFVTDPMRRKLVVIGDHLGLISPDQIYTDEYYSKRRLDPFRSESHDIADTLVEKFQPNSVIDFGCAIGTYLERFEEHGIQIHGVEGNNAAFRYAVVPRNYLEHHDLRQPYQADDYFDLVLSIEVAEHIPERYAVRFVNTLAKSGEVVVMTAAPPGQGGTHHVNEKPPEYWIDLFEKHGMEYDQESTEELKDEISVSSLYHVPKNMLVFRKNHP